jgi:hypothetical protein
MRRDVPGSENQRRGSEDLDVRMLKGVGAAGKSKSPVLKRVSAFQ